MRILICANIVSIVYQVNGGEEVSLDFRTITTQGIPLQPGDHLKIVELWCHAGVDDETKTLFAESYIGAGSYNSETYRQTEKQGFLSGVHELIAGHPLNGRLLPNILRSS